MLKTTKCPNCGGNLRIPEDQTLIQCHYCGGEFFNEHPITSTIDQSPKAENFVADAPAQASLKIDCEGVWMLIDAEVKVFLDNQLIGSGSVKKGFDLTMQTTSGKHFVELKMSLRTQNYSFEIPSGGAYRLKIEYSRTWGNFSKEFEITRLN